MQVVCSNCNNSNPSNNKFCGTCGASLETAKMVREDIRPIQRARPRKSKKGLLVVVLGVGFLGCVACFIIALVNQSTPTYKATATARVIAQTTTEVIAQMTEDARPTDTPQPTTTPTMTIEELKATAKQITYDELARNTEKHIGEFLYFRGKVVQVIEGSGQEMGLRVEVTEGEYGFWDDLVWVNFKGSRLLEDDIIQFWGTVEGRYSYKTVLGSTVTIPEITALVLSLEK